MQGARPAKRLQHLARRPAAGRYRRQPGGADLVRAEPGGRRARLSPTAPCSRAPATESCADGLPMRRGRTSPVAATASTRWRTAHRPTPSPAPASARHRSVPDPRGHRFPPPEPDDAGAQALQTVLSSILCAAAAGRRHQRAGFAPFAENLRTIQSPPTPSPLIEGMLGIETIHPENSMSF